jgi:hypothetical protein
LEFAATIGPRSSNHFTVRLAARDHCEALCLSAVAEALTGGKPNADLHEAQQRFAELTTSDDQLYARCQFASTYAQLDRWPEAEHQIKMFKMLPSGNYRDSALTTFVSSAAEAQELRRAQRWFDEVQSQPFIDLSLKYLAIAEAHRTASTAA